MESFKFFYWVPSGRLQGGGLTKGKVSLMVSPPSPPIAHVCLYAVSIVLSMPLSFARTLYQYSKVRYNYDFYLETFPPHVNIPSATQTNTIEIFFPLSP